MGDSIRVCLQWPNLGPYHTARLEALAAHAPALRVAALETAGSERSYLWERAPNVGVDVRTVFAEAVFEDLRPQQIYSGVTNALDELQPDVVVTNSYSLPDARAALRWAVKRRRPVVVTTDSHLDASLRVAWRERVKSRLMSLYDSAVVAGTPHADYLAGLGFSRKRIFLGLDVVDNSHFERGRQLRQQAQSEGGDQLPAHFLYCGRLVDKKNVPLLIQAYQVYREKAPPSPAPWGLRILGDGPDADTFREMCREQRVPEVTFLGAQPYDTLPEHYGAAGCLVLPSKREQWGLVVNEAMAAGAPLIVSDAAGCARDLVSPDENGFTFESGDVEHLADRLHKMAGLSNATRRSMSDKSAEIIAAWGLDRFATSMEHAVEVALTQPVRKALDARLVLEAINTFARRIDSFHHAERA